MKNIRLKYSSICVQVIIQSLPHAGAGDDEVFSARHLETASLKKAAVIARQIFSACDDCSCLTEEIVQFSSLSHFRVCFQIFFCHTDAVR